MEPEERISPAALHRYLDREGWSRVADGEDCEWWNEGQLRAKGEVQLSVDPHWQGRAMHCGYALCVRSNIEAIARVEGRTYELVLDELLALSDT